MWNHACFSFCVWLISHKVSSVGNSGPHFRIREFSFHNKSAGDPELWNQGPLFFDLAKSGISPEGQRHWVSQTTIFLNPAHGRSSQFWTIKRYNSASSLGLMFAQSLEFASSQQDPCMDSYPPFTMDTFGNLHDAWPCRQGCQRVISVGWIVRLANTSRNLVFPVHLFRSPGSKWVWNSFENDCWVWFLTTPSSFSLLLFGLIFIFIPTFEIGLSFWEVFLHRGIYGLVQHLESANSVDINN